MPANDDRDLAARRQAPRTMFAAVLLASLAACGQPESGSNGGDAATSEGTAASAARSAQDAAQLERIVDRPTHRLVQAHRAPLRHMAVQGGAKA